METRANYILVGVFTLAVIAGAFGFVYWFSHLGEGGNRVPYRVVFDGPVSGLRTGAAVLFNGIRVGEVTTMQISAENPRRVEVLISIDRQVPMKTDTRAALDVQLLSGIAAVSLTGGSTEAGPLVAKGAGGPPTLAAESSAGQDLAQGARDLMSRADMLMRRLDNVLTENEASLKKSMRNVESFTDTLARNSQRIDRILAGLEDITGKDGKLVVDHISQAAQSVREAAIAVRSLADHLDRRTADITSGISRLADKGLREWETLAASGRNALGEFQRAVRNFDRNPSRVIWGGSSTPEASSRGGRR